MSKMSELDFQIRDLLDEGLKPERIATLLACPLELVYDTLEADEMDQYEEDMFFYEESGVAELAGVIDFEDEVRYE